MKGVIAAGKNMVGVPASAAPLPGAGSLAHVGMIGP
jgi:hypothetical protein